MYNDIPRNVEFIASKKIIDQIIEWFGTDIQITEKDSQTVIVNIRVSLQAMEYWAMQYLNYVEVTSPNELR